MAKVKAYVPKEAIFWTAVLLVSLFLLGVFSNVLLPFAFGLLVAYLLNPVINFFSSKGVSRGVSSLIILLTFFSFFTMLILILIPILITQLWQFFHNVPLYAQKLNLLLLDSKYNWLEENTVVGRLLIEENVTKLLQQGGAFLSSILLSLWSSSKSLLSLVSFFVVAPVIAFYFMVDWEKMVAKIDSWIPRHRLEVTRKLFSDMDRTVAGFIRGQSVVSLIISLYFITTLGFLGLNFSFLIGVLIGILSFIPYVGTIIGFIISIGMAFLQFWPDDWVKIVIAVAIFFVGHFVEGYILQPKLVGSSVGLHPIWLMIALFAFSYLFGFTGTLIAVPVAAILGVLVRFVLNHYLNSSFYNPDKVN